MLFTDCENWSDKMIKFIVCDDIKEFRLKIKDFINDVLVGSKLEYDVIQFEKYDKDFAKLIKDDGAAKIYILDIELKEGISGIDIARRIRKVDWNSIIIMVTSHNELGYDALKAQIMLLDFISKYDNCERNLKRVLKKAIKQIDSKKVIAYEYLGVAYRVYLDDIIYVVKDTVDRKCIIKTDYNEVIANKNMNEVIDELDERFYLTHQSCLVNTQKISRIDFKNNTIYFQNGMSINLLSRDKRKGLKKYVGIS